MSTPPPVPPVADAARVQTATIVSPTATIDLQYPLYGDGGDLEIYVNNALLDPSRWTVTSISGVALSIITQPCTDARIQFNPILTTGTVIITGAWRPRRVSQPTAPGITRREINQYLSNVISGMREIYDTLKRSLRAPPGDVIGPLPTSADRANRGLIFDAFGNPTAGVIPATGTISAAMQPVVSAATLSLGRALFGFGTMAGENIGAGLQDDGAGAVRTMYTVASDSTNQAVGLALHATQRLATGALTYTLPRANTLFNGFGFWVAALTSPVVVAIDASDSFSGASAGASMTVPLGSKAFISTNAAASGIWSATLAQLAGLNTQLSRLPRSYIDGCIMSNGTDATNDINVADGVCRDSTNSYNITVAALSGKQLDANWAPGANAGMRNSGAAITDTTFHIYAVSKADGTQDIYAHTSAVIATVLAALQAETGGSSYLYARRIASIIRESGAIVAFSQIGDYFARKVAVVDINTTQAGTPTLRALKLPIGVKVRANLNYECVLASGATANILVSDADNAQTAALGAAPLSTVGASINGATAVTLLGRTEAWTNTSGQVYFSCTSSQTIFASTIGWTDLRGRDA